LAATWSETGRVHIWDLTAALSNIDSGQSSSSQSALFTFAGHQSEGYAVDWNTIDKGFTLDHFCKVLQLFFFIVQLIDSTPE